MKRQKDAGGWRDALEIVACSEAGTKTPASHRMKRHFTKEPRCWMQQ